MFNFEKLLVAKCKPFLQRVKYVEITRPAARSTFMKLIMLRGFTFNERLICECVTLGHIQWASYICHYQIERLQVNVSTLSARETALLSTHHLCDNTQ